MRNSDCSLSIAGSWKDNDSTCKTLDYPVTHKEHKLKITQSETSIGQSIFVNLGEEGEIFNREIFDNIFMLLPIISRISSTLVDLLK